MLALGNIGGEGGREGGREKGGGGKPIPIYTLAFYPSPSSHTIYGLIVSRHSHILHTGILSEPLATVQSYSTQCNFSGHTAVQKEPP